VKRNVLVHFVTLMGTGCKYSHFLCCASYSDITEPLRAADVVCELFVTCVFDYCCLGVVDFFI